MSFFAFAACLDPILFKPSPLLHQGCWHSCRVSACTIAPLSAAVTHSHGYTLHAWSQLAWLFELSVFSTFWVSCKDSVTLLPHLLQHLLQHRRVFTLLSVHKLNKVIELITKW